MSVGTDNQRMLALGERGVDGALHGMSVYGLHAEVLHRISVILPQFRHKRLLIGAFGKQRVDTEQRTHLPAQRVAARLPFSTVIVFRSEIRYELHSVGSLSARVFVWLYLIEVAVLLQGVEVERLEDIVECLLDGIRTNTEIGIVELQSRSVHIIFQFHIEALRHIVEHIAQRTGVLRLEALRLTCRGGKQGGYK